MNALNARQTDALTELISIAFGLTAAKLSEISGHRVRMEGPGVAVRPMDTLAAELSSLGTGDVAALHQVFTGPISGDAILLLNPDGAVKLSNLLVEADLQSLRLDSAAGEILTEVANMLLSACLGVFGNLLQVRVRFSTPRLHLESVDHFFTSLATGADEPLYGVGITTTFNIQEQDVDGRIVIVLGASSLERLIQAVERWESSQVAQA